jgi:predicted dehydrogenase
MEQVKVGIIGVGGIAKGVHIPGYKKSNDAVITALCDIDPKALKAGSEICDVASDHCFSDYHDLINCEDVDIVDICTPNVLHCEMAEEALKKGKPFSIEKPMGISYAETRNIEKMARENNVAGHVCFSWRYRSYIRFMKWLVEKGAVGNLYHVYIRCIKDSGLWPGRKLEWRFDKEQAGTGVLGDLASHMFDLTRFVTGEVFSSVSSDTGIYIKERQKINSDDYGTVTTDDWCNALAKMESGLNATYQISRCATTIGDWMAVELYGSNGLLAYHSLDGKQTLEICSGEIDREGKGRHVITPPSRFDANQSQAFVNLAKHADDGLSATTEDGVICQRILDTTAKAAAEKRWVLIDEIQ